MAWEIGKLIIFVLMFWVLLSLLVMFIVFPPLMKWLDKRYPVVSRNHDTND